MAENGAVKKLLNRIDVILRNPNKVIDRREASFFRLIFGKRNNCIICKGSRDGDPTGVTCGEERCLLALSDKIAELEVQIEKAEEEKKVLLEDFKGMEKIIHEFARKLGEIIKDNDFEGFLDDAAQELCKRRTMEIDILAVARIIGVNTERKIYDILADVLYELQEIENKIKSIEKNGKKS